MKPLVIGDQYGKEYSGTYRVKKLVWSEMREALNVAVQTRDKMGALEALLSAAVTGPVALTREKLATYPGELVWTLLQAALDENGLKGEEASFL